MSTYLITGIAGFIGSSLARALLQKGEQVRGIDNFSTGKPENISEIENQIDFHKADLLDSEATKRACLGVDYILHEAAIPSVPRSIKNPAETNRSNVDGTLNLLIAARDAKVRRVVYAASSSAYGETQALPKSEDLALSPISPYAVSKLAGEHYMQSFWRSYGMETVCLRYFNVFGPRQDPVSPYSGVLAKFITQMLEGGRPVIFGDGRQSRDFTYVENVVQANFLACKAPAGDVVGKVFNIASGRGIDLNEMYSVLQRLTGFLAPAEYGPPRQGDVKHSLADLTRAEKYLGYQPTVSFEEGLQRTVEWYRSVGDEELRMQVSISNDRRSSPSFLSAYTGDIR